MAGNTKNLGQVAGVHIGTTPPENTVLIWYDSTPSQKCHKVYDAARRVWVILDQKIISYITYSELVNIAKNVGLSIGKYYQITDKANVLAIAITTTKVQYNDTIGNILIDDLGTNIQYHVTSSNLSVDDVTGVFDETNKKLVFRFNETVPDFTADDYILGKRQRNNVWSLAKYRLSSFLSKVTGNSIIWNGGFYFNFNEALKRQLDKKGGVISKDSYDRDIKQISTDISNVGKANQEIIQNAKTNTENATTPTAIYDKELPDVLETGGEAIDIAKGDKLVTIISKFQRYINRFKYATGIYLSKDFSITDVSGEVNNNDTVETAIAKLSKVSHSAGILYDYDNSIKGKVSSGDTVENAFSKVENQIKDSVQTLTNKDSDLDKKITDQGKNLSNQISSLKNNLDNLFTNDLSGWTNIELVDGVTGEASYIYPFFGDCIAVKINIQFVKYNENGTNTYEKLFEAPIPHNFGFAAVAVNTGNWRGVEGAIPVGLSPSGVLSNSKDGPIQLSQLSYSTYAINAFLIAPIIREI